MASKQFMPAQTNTALYGQLHALGHSPADILRVQEAYRLALRLFNGRYRKTERAFICHAVGAASSVAHFERDVDVVIAGMLHAAYDSGQFPDGRFGKASEPHRTLVRSVVGERAESLVFRYPTLDFDTGGPERLAAGPLPAGMEDILFMALAHEIDDLADIGLAIAPKYGESIASRLEACVSLARRIGREELADTLAAQASLYGDTQWATALRSERTHGFRIAPSLGAYLRLRRARRKGQSAEVF
ncbi:HD domain-containing protein [Aquibium carbonis]|uniref:HD domain-containing protein n=1 Tax=Aquibium carbonis TaxID=2495581 RepID=A0A3R9Y9K7_9HYPH|nr:HD domain-containing protein [Aquibium carbonis]RST87235.1 HD domain-containing protein [Aquibium carbonis]